MASILGIIGGAMEGGGKAAVGALREEQEQFGRENLLKMKVAADQELARLHATLQQETHAANADTDIANIPRKGAAETTVHVDRAKALMPGRVEERRQFAAVDVASEIEKFEKLAPMKRKEAIADAVESLKALSTPEMLAASRKIALSKHIVDPNWTLIPQADGTVMTYDTKSGKAGSVLKGEDGKPIIRRDPSELTAATAVINMANRDKMIAETAYRDAQRAAKEDMENGPALLAKANASWAAAQAEHKALVAPAYAQLYGKANMKQVETPPAAPVAPKIKDRFSTGGKGGQTATGLIGKMIPSTDFQ